MDTPDTRKIIHIDMDAFYASVEQRDNPAYRGRPIVVGGRPDKRGVVAAASYESRKYGIHSAMSAYRASKLCPELIFVRPRFDVYKAVSQQIREIFHDYTDLVEPLSLDEAYLDVTVNHKDNPSATWVAREIKDRIRETTQLTASAGVSYNKFLAKVASDMDKPDGLFVIRPHEAEAFLIRLPIEKFYGIGKVTAGRMKALGIHTGGDLRRWSEHDLIHEFGRAGEYYYQIVRGHDDRCVNPVRIRKSIGSEETFEEDLTTLGAMMDALSPLADDILDTMEKYQRYGRTLTLKVKYNNFQQITRSKTLEEPLNNKALIMALARELLNYTEVDTRPVRLLGLTASKLDPPPESVGADSDDPIRQLLFDFCDNPAKD